jgi:hypothetical protein
MKLKLLRAYDLMDDTAFWQRQQRFDTTELHGTGSSFWGYDNPEFCEESGACQ